MKQDNFIPEISKVELYRRAKYIKPIVSFNGVQHYIKDVDLENVSYIWDAKKEKEVTGLILLGQRITYHTFGYYLLFKPSIAEVLAQIPEEYLEEVVAFEIVAKPQDADDLNRYTDITNAGYHMAITHFYKRKEKVMKVIKKGPVNSALKKMKVLKDKPEKLSIGDVADFPKKGIMFKDISPLLANPEEFSGLIKHLAKSWKGKVDKIGGFDARGFIFASTLAYEMKLPFFMLRKKGKLPGETISVKYGLEYGEASLEVGKSAVSAGDKVLLVDDVLATGGTAEAGCKLVEELGGVVIGVQFVLELESLSGRNLLSGYDVHSVVIS